MYICSICKVLWISFPVKVVYTRTQIYTQPTVLILLWIFGHMLVSSFSHTCTHYWQKASTSLGVGQIISACHLHTYPVSPKELPLNHVNIYATAQTVSMDKSESCICHCLLLKISLLLDVLSVRAHNQQEDLLGSICVDIYEVWGTC